MGVSMLESELRNMIKFVLKEYHTKEREDLIFGTISQESLRGKYKRQIGYDINSSYGAFGICQIELNTAKFIESYIERKKGKFLAQFIEFRSNLPLQLDIMSSDFLSIFLCFVYYWTKPEPIPVRNDNDCEDGYILALGRYWKKYWNTELGAGSPEEFFRNYNKGE